MARNGVCSKKLGGSAGRIAVPIQDQDASTKRYASWLGICGLSHPRNRAGQRCLIGIKCSSATDWTLAPPDRAVQRRFMDIKYPEFEN
jgi:hypothetical protein